MINRYLCCFSLSLKLSSIPWGRQAWGGPDPDGTRGPPRDGARSTQTVCFTKGSAQGPRKKIEFGPKLDFSRRNLDYQPLKSTQTHPIPVGKPTSPSDRPRSGPESPRQLPRLPGTSRGTTKIRNRSGICFSAPEPSSQALKPSKTTQEPSEIARKPSLTVGRAVKRSRVTPVAKIREPVGDPFLGAKPEPSSPGTVRKVNLTAGNPVSPWDTP